MKKWLIAVVAVALLAGCGDNESENKSKEASGEELNVDKGLRNVEVTLPQSFFEESTEAEILSAAEEEGFSDAKINEDGSVTYKMSKSKHKELMTEMKQEMVTSIEEMVTSGDYPSIKEISYNKKFDEFDIKVKRAEYENSFDGFAILGLVFSGAYYSAFDGKSGDDLKLTFNMIDAETNEVYDSSVYPEDWEDEEEAGEGE